jgi:hypothetical protein
MRGIFTLTLAFVALLLVVPGVLFAAPPAGTDHPAYLHALTDLRHAPRTSGTPGRRGAP